jgi:hypothetical protein
VATTAIGSISGPDSYRTKWGPEEQFVADAQAQFGSSNFGHAFTDFLLPNSAYGWTITNTGSPSLQPYDPATTSTSDPLETSVSGMLYMQTQAAAGSSSSQISNSWPAVYPSGIYGGAYSWRLTARFRIPTAMAATTYVGFGLFDALSTKSLLFGFNGALSTTRIQCQYGGSFAGSSVDIAPLDTAWHTFTAWVNKGGNLNMRLDNSAPISASIPWASHYNYFQPIIKVSDTAGGTIRGIKIDYYGIASPAPGR